MSQNDGNRGQSGVPRPSGIPRLSGIRPPSGPPRAPDTTRLRARRPEEFEEDLAMRNVLLRQDTVDQAQPSTSEHYSDRLGSLGLGTLAAAREQHKVAEARLNEDLLEQAYQRHHDTISSSMAGAAGRNTGEYDSLDPAGLREEKAGCPCPSNPQRTSGQPGGSERPSGIRPPSRSRSSRAAEDAQGQESTNTGHRTSRLKPPMSYRHTSRNQQQNEPPRQNQARQAQPFRGGHLASQRRPSKNPQQKDMRPRRISDAFESEEDPSETDVRPSSIPRYRPLIKPLQEHVERISAHQPREVGPVYRNPTVPLYGYGEMHDEEYQADVAERLAVPVQRVASPPKYTRPLDLLTREPGVMPSVEEQEQSALRLAAAKRREIQEEEVIRPCGTMSPAALLESANRLAQAKRSFEEAVVTTPRGPLVTLEEQREAAERLAAYEPRQVVEEEVVGPHGVMPSVDVQEESVSRLVQPSQRKLDQIAEKARRVAELKRQAEKEARRHSGQPGGSERPSGIRPPSNRRHTLANESAAVSAEDVAASRMNWVQSQMHYKREASRPRLPKENPANVIPHKYAPAVDVKNADPYRVRRKHLAHESEVPTVRHEGTKYRPRENDDVISGMIVTKPITEPSQYEEYPEDLDQSFVSWKSASHANHLAKTKAELEALHREDNQGVLDEINRARSQAWEDLRRVQQHRIDSMPLIGAIPEQIEAQQRRDAQETVDERKVHLRLLANHASLNAIRWHLENDLNKREETDEDDDPDSPLGHNFLTRLNLTAARDDLRQKEDQRQGPRSPVKPVNFDRKYLIDGLDTKHARKFKEDMRKMANNSYKRGMVNNKKIRERDEENDEELKPRKKSELAEFLDFEKRLKRFDHEKYDKLAEKQLRKSIASLTEVNEEPTEMNVLFDPAMRNPQNPEQQTIRLTCAVGSFASMEVETESDGEVLSTASTVIMMTARQTEMQLRAPSQTDASESTTIANQSNANDTYDETANVSQLERLKRMVDQEDRDVSLALKRARPGKNAFKRLAKQEEAAGGAASRSFLPSGTLDMSNFQGTTQKAMTYQAAAKMMEMQERGLPAASDPSDIINMLFPDGENRMRVNAPLLSRRHNVAVPLACVNSRLVIPEHMMEEYSDLRKGIRGGDPRNQDNHPLPLRSVRGSQVDLDTLTGWALFDISSSTPGGGAEIPANPESPDDAERGKKTAASGTSGAPGLGKGGAVFTLQSEGPAFDNKVQLRGTSVPQWFPGYFTAMLPDIGISETKRASRVLINAYQAVGPADFPFAKQLIVDS